MGRQGTKHIHIWGETNKPWETAKEKMGQRDKVELTIKPGAFFMLLVICLLFSLIWPFIKLIT